MKKLIFIILTTIIYTVAANAQQAVDLGLSVRWADRNMGSVSATDAGWYLAWGELTPKQEYSIDNYRFGMGDYRAMTKYVFPSKETTSEPDNLRYLEPEDDIATTALGEGWRMPTYAEITELAEQCTWLWVNDATHPGYRVTGPNGNHIFLPASGMYSGDALTLDTHEGYYWSGEVITFNADFAHALRFTSRTVNHYVLRLAPRIVGCQVRAVYAGNNTVEEANVDNVSISASGNTITVVGGEGQPLYVFDIMGRTIHHTQSASHTEKIHTPSTGVYIVRAGNHKALKIVTMLNSNR